MIHWHQHIDRLGVDSDTMIAQELGVSRSLVTKTRISRGISAPPRKQANAVKAGKDSK